MAKRSTGLDILQAAHRMRVHYHTLYTAVRCGALRGLKDASGTWRFSTSDLEAWARVELPKVGRPRGVKNRALDAVEAVSV
jgi:excisionase family DNA binding protein